MTEHEVLSELLWLRREADCSRRRVGAVVVKDGVIVGKGANTLPTGSCLGGDCPRGRMTYAEQPKDVGYATSGCVSVHAEDEALGLAGLYAFGATIYVTEDPCPGCSELIARAGVQETIVITLP